MGQNTPVYSHQRGGRIALPNNYLINLSDRANYIHRYHHYATFRPHTISPFLQIRRREDILCPPYVDNLYGAERFCM